MLLIDNPEDCGLGAGAQCCAYLAIGAKGFECARESAAKAAVDKRIFADTLNAKYVPRESSPYPKCQDERPH